MYFNALQVLPLTCSSNFIHGFKFLDDEDDADDESYYDDEDGSSGFSEDDVTATVNGNVINHVSMTSPPAGVSYHSKVIAEI